MNYVSSVFVNLGKVTPEEKIWLKAINDIIEAKPWDAAADWTEDDHPIPLDANGAPLLYEGSLPHKLYMNVRSLLDDSETSWGFNLQFDSAGEGSFFSDEWGGNVDALLELLQLFLSNFRPTEKFGFEWGWQEGNEGGGGAAVVSATNHETVTTGQWLRERLDGGR